MTIFETEYFVEARVIVEHGIIISRKWYLLDQEANTKEFVREENKTPSGFNVDDQIVRTQNYIYRILQDSETGNVLSEQWLLQRGPGRKAALYCDGETAMVVHHVFDGTPAISFGHDYATVDEEEFDTLHSSGP